MGRLQCRLAPNPDVRSDELLAAQGHALVGHRVLVRTADNGGALVCRVRPSPYKMTDPEVLLVNDSAARRELKSTAQEFSADVEQIWLPRAVWFKCDARLVLLTAFVTTIVGVLSFLGFAVPDKWTWWPAVPGSVAAVAGLSLAALEATGRIP